MTEIDEAIRETHWGRKAAIRAERHRQWMAECRTADIAIAREREAEPPLKREREPDPQPYPQPFEESERIVPYTFPHICAADGECAICQRILARSL